MFGEIVKARRTALGMSLREFCRRLGEDPSNWSKVERGVLKPPLRIKKLREIAGVLDISEGSAGWEELVDTAVIGAGEIPGYIRENREVYDVLPELFRTIGGASLTAEEIRRMVEQLVERGASNERVGRKAIIVAGPNGAGKTTFVREYLKEHDIPYISADAIAEQLSDGDIREVALEAGRSFFADLFGAIESGKSFIVETTLSGRGFRRAIRRMKAEGYTINLFFVYLASPDFCVSRIEERTRKGGHHVPEEDVIRRFHRSIVNFWSVYRFGVDGWSLVCNTAQESVGVAWGNEKELMILDELLYAAFLYTGGLPDER